MSLKQPAQKMSKSHEDPRSRILLTDSHEDLQHKIRLALTDSISGLSYDPLARPGVANLLSILSHLDTHGRSCEELVRSYGTMSMREFKEEVARRISESFADIRDKYERIMTGGSDTLEATASEGAKRAAMNAHKKLKLVRDVLGF